MRMRVLAGMSLASLLCAQSLPEMRMLPAEMRGNAVDGNQIGSSGLAGVHTKVIFGDPSKVGFYSILLFVPAHTTIQGHSHRDDRMATVISGTWYFGYGDRFDAKSLKKFLPAASIRSRARTTTSHARTRTLSSCKFQGMVRPTRATSIQPTSQNRHNRSQSACAVCAELSPKDSGYHEQMSSIRTGIRSRLFISVSGSLCDSDNGFSSDTVTSTLLPKNR
jgi:hypothetical protein